MTSFGIIYFIPVYVHVKGSSSAQAGLQFIPHAAGNACGAVLAGVLIRPTGKYLALNGISQLCLLVAAALAYSLRQPRRFGVHSLTLPFMASVLASC